MSQTRNVAILLFDEVEVLDFAGPFEVFSVAGQRSDGPPPFNVCTVAEHDRPVSARNGLSVNPRHTLANCPQPDILVVPGGYGTRPLLGNQTVINWIKQCEPRCELVLSVCSGALVLAHAGLLDGLRATTHHSAIDELKNTGSNVEVCPNERYVDNGRIIVSAGVAAGIDMSFHTVARLLGDDVAIETAKYIEYDWPPRSA